MWNWGRDKLVGSDIRLRSIFCSRDSRDKPTEILDPSLSLPKRSNNDYPDRLGKLLELYRERVVDSRPAFSNASSYSKLYNLVNSLCTGMPLVLNRYHNGFPAEAFDEFEKLMDNLVDKVSLPTLGDVGPKETEGSLYRMRLIGDSRLYSPQELFHVPTNHREWISSGRYSIAGFPSLYLTSSLELATREIASGGGAIASRFEPCNERLRDEVLDFGIRPDDFDFAETGADTQAPVPTSDFIENYLAWYPLLAACSFIRANPYNVGFHDEYVIPQLLMQWLRRTGMPPHFPPPSVNPVPPGNGPLESSTSLLKEIDDVLGRIDKSIDLLRGLLSEGFDGFDRELDELERLSEELCRLIYQIITKFRQDAARHEASDRISRQGDDIRDKLAKKNLDNLAKSSGRRIGSSQDRRLGHIRKLVKNAFDNLEWGRGEGAPIKGIRYFSCRDLHAANLGRNYVFPSEFDVSTNGNTQHYSLALASKFRWTKPHYLSDYESPEKCEEALDTDVLISGIDIVKG